MRIGDKKRKTWLRLAPRPGLEPGTLRLTAERSTIELPRSRATQEHCLTSRVTFITQARNLRQRERSP